MPTGDADVTTFATQSAAEQESCCKTFPKLAALIGYLDSLRNRADLNRLSELLTNLDVRRSDIAPACIFGARGYKRNTISRSDWYELLALCWHSGDCTPIHDHQGVSCAFKIIEGDGTEIRFRTTPSGLICPTAAVQMNPGYICAALDADIHQVANMQPPGQDLITLHIYSPPIKKMNTYEFASPISPECEACYDKSPTHPC
jgi:cysteine dioxygenase